MAHPPPTRLHIDPPMRDWRIAPRHGRTTPVVATGHQPYLWHPGVLAKYLAADAFAQHVAGTTLNVVVEHNAIGPLSIDLPVQQADRLSVLRVLFDDRPEATGLPPNRLDPLEIDRVTRPIADGVVRTLYTKGFERPDEVSLPPLGLLSEAYTGLGVIASLDASTNLASQTSAVLNHLVLPYVRQPLTPLPTSELVTPSFVDRLLADPLGCVRCYNRAARAYPEAGIRPLYAGRDIVEAPLWAQADGASVPVYIDLGDSKRPQLFTQHERIDLTGTDMLRYLRPRAITLSALMRSEYCDLFIHGTGGAVYDQVTERWWRDWTGEGLVPMAVVSADVYLPFDAPTATRDALARAHWFDHHLPHNVDRYTDTIDDAEAALRTEKRELLDRMDDDRNKRRRAAAFARLHAINTELSTRHALRLSAAGDALKQARVGVGNAAIAGRRDWCLALYTPDSLRTLRQMIADLL